VDQTRSALIVASDQYTDPRLRRLRAPASDARALAAVLQDPGIGGFEVRTLLNEPAHVVTLAVEEFFADRRAGDLLLVHFSGHGIKDEDGELYFAAANTVLGRLGATAVAAEFVGRRMNRSRSRRVVLLLDCCYAGAFERGLVARAGVEIGIEQQFGGRGRAVITASSAMEYAFEAGELADPREVAPSVFTSALVEGLETGEADQDQDGLVGLDELYDYVYDKVRAATPNQTPGKWVFGVEGDLYIARRARPVATPARLPPELQQAIDSPLAGVRGGAVQELAAVLRGRHAGMALAARLALEQLTEDDSRAVAAAATAALGGQPLPVPPRPAPPELTLSDTVIDLGQIPLHGRSPERRIRIGNAGGGDLNARAATSASWLKLRQAGDELMVAVDTTAAGDYEGIVTVDSDGGTATVRVHARVRPGLRPDTGAAAATRPNPVAIPPVRAQPGPQQDPALAGPVPAATAGAIPSAAETALAPANPMSGRAVEGRGSAAPDRPQPPIIPRPEFSRPPVDGTSAEVVPADPAAAATIDPMSGGAPGHHADMPSSTPIMTGPARSGPHADDGTGAALPPTMTAADQQTHATAATANAASDPTGKPGAVGEPGRLTEELDKPPADASRPISAGNVLTAGQSAPSGPGSGGDGARPARHWSPRPLVTALASAARRLRHHVVITSLVVLVAVVIGGGYIFWRVSQSQYYVAANSSGRVLIYRGINENILGINWFSPYQQTAIQLDQVPSNYQQTVKTAYSSGSLAQVQQTVMNIAAAVDECRAQYAKQENWVSQENAYSAYQAKVAAAKQRGLSTANLGPPLPNPGPRPLAAGQRPSGTGGTCPSPVAFGIPASALTPTPPGSS
jgi:hypothetical protein